MGEDPNGVEYELLDAYMFIVEVLPAELEKIEQFLENGQAPKGISNKKKKILAMKVAPYSIINGFLY